MGFFNKIKEITGFRLHCRVYWRLQNNIATFTKPYIDVYKTVYWRLQNYIDVYKTNIDVYKTVYRRLQNYIDVYKTAYWRLQNRILTFTESYIDVWKTVYWRLQNRVLTFTNPYIDVYKTIYWLYKTVYWLLQTRILTFTRPYIDVYKTVYWRLQTIILTFTKQRNNETKRSHKFSRLKNYFVYDCILICSFYSMNLLVYSFGNTLSMIKYWYVVFTTWIYWSIQTQPIFFTLNYTYK